MYVCLHSSNIKTELEEKKEQVAVKWNSEICVEVIKLPAFTLKYSYYVVSIFLLPLHYVLSVVSSKLFWLGFHYHYRGF